jgi:hypothetical protein
VHPDFLAVIDFDEDSHDYGKVVNTVPLPPPGNIGNEPHHCHLSANKNILGCGGLLSLLSGQPGIFFFDVSRPRSPKFLFATSAPQSSITDEFLPLRAGGFLVTQMGSASGGAPGRVAEFDYRLQLVHEWPDNPPLDGFNPHGIDARPELNLLVTSDFILLSSSHDRPVREVPDADRAAQHRVTRDTVQRVTLDSRFNLDFNTAFATGPARPHGIGMK